MKKVAQILAILSVISCGKSYKLKKGDLDYIPYKGNETLVFESDQGHADTIFLSGTHPFNGCGDPLAIFPDKCEGIMMTCTHTDPNYDRYLDGHDFVSLVAHGDETDISFDIAMKGSWFYDYHPYSLTLFDNMPNRELTIRNKKYSDVKVFEAGEYGRQFKDRDNYAERIYWSVKEGFLGLDKKDEKWRLVGKY